FRLLNAIRPGVTGLIGERFREARAIEVLEAVRRQSPNRDRPLPPNHGRGLPIAVRHVGAGKSTAIFRPQADGRVEVLTGLPDQGAGAYTMIERVAAAALSVDPERIVVTRRSTTQQPYDSGAGGSRVTHAVGQATHHGATVLKQRLEELAAEVMGWPAGETRLEHDRFVVGDGSAGASFADVAARIGRGQPVEVEGSYDAGSHGHDEAGDYDFMAFEVEVEVDPETGQVAVRDVLMVADVGTIINPLAHQGQLEGGFITGLGAALMEELPVEAGKVAVASLGEYKLPAMPDVPP